MQNIMQPYYTCTVFPSYNIVGNYVISDTTKVPFKDSQPFICNASGQLILGMQDSYLFEWGNTQSQKAAC